MTTSTAQKEVRINRTEMLPSTIEQLYYLTSEANKPEILCKLIEAADDMYGLVFSKPKSLVIDLTQYLKGRGYRTDCLHGDMDQDARERTMRSFANEGHDLDLHRCRISRPGRQRREPCDQLFDPARAG